MVGILGEFYSPGNQGRFRDDGVRYKVQAPPLIGPVWYQHRPASPERPFPATASLHLQFLFRVEPPDLLPVHLPALAFQHHVHMSIAEPEPLIRNILHGLAQAAVARAYAAIPRA